MGTKKTPPDLLPGTLDLLILRTLLRGPMHGYGIAEHIQQTSEDILQVEEGSLYPALYRLELDGAISAKWGFSENNRKAKYYEITKRGKKLVAEQQHIWDRLSTAAEETKIAVGVAESTAVDVVVHAFPGVVRIAEAHIVKSDDSVAMRPMTIEEAVKEAEFRDREVFVFRDHEGRVKVIHRKKDGKMELIEAP